MTVKKRECDYCGVTIHAAAAFHPDGPVDGKHRYVHLACSHKIRLKKEARATRMVEHGEAMLVALKGLLWHLKHTGATESQPDWTDEEREAVRVAEKVIELVEGK